MTNLNVEVRHSDVDGHTLVDKGFHGAPSLVDRNLGELHVGGDIGVVGPLWWVPLLKRHKLKPHDPYDTIACK